MIGENELIGNSTSLRSGMSQKSQTVLIVDDSIPQHKLITVLMAEESINCESAYNGEAGLALAEKLQPDLIILDVDMPDLNGFDVCRLLKVNPATKDIPIIFLTASASMDEKICGLSLEAVDYITKPFDPWELTARVRMALRTKRLLDMVPKHAPAPRNPGASASDGQLNARLSMEQLTLARSENPWSRGAPASQYPSPVDAKNGASLPRL
jgi:DNA-binding response OmpR family regulator